MIIIAIGFCTIIAAVKAAEVGGNTEVAILLATAGSMIMVWGIDRND